MDGASSNLPVTSAASCHHRQPMANVTPSLRIDDVLRGRPDLVKLITSQSCPRSRKPCAMCTWSHHTYEDKVRTPRSSYISPHRGLNLRHSPTHRSIQ